MKQMALSSKFPLTILNCLVYSSRTSEKKDRGKTSIVVYLLFLSVLMLFIGCSKKNNEKVSETSEPCRPSNAADAFLAPAADSNSIPGPAPATDGNDPNKHAKAAHIFKITLDEPVVSDVLAELSYSGTDSERKIELLDSLTGLAAEQDPNILGVAQKATRDQDAEVVQAALDLLDGYESPDILPAVETAMQHADEQIRENAVQLLENVDDPQVGDLIAWALNDASEDVRSAAIAVAEGQNEDIQLAVSQTAIASPYDEVKGAAVSMLESMRNKKAVDVLIDGLKDDNSDFRETVSETLDSLIDKELKSYQEAKDWWNRNKNKYDAELFEIKEGKEK